QQGIQARPVQGSEARDRFHVCRDGGLCRQPLRQVQRRLPALHGVEDIPLHRVHIRRRQGTEEQIDPGGADRGPLLLSHQLNTLGGGVRPLVELSRQGLHAEGDAVPGGQGCGSIVHLRLREHCPHRPAEGGLVQALHVIAV
ncbi:SipL SPOCS domain-containing protein, partial [Dysosmobacter welbionis]